MGLEYSSHRLRNYCKEQSAPWAQIWRGCWDYLIYSWNHAHRTLNHILSPGGKKLHSSVERVLTSDSGLDFEPSSTTYLAGCSSGKSPISASFWILNLRVTQDLFHLLCQVGVHFNFLNFINLLIYFWLRWVFVAARGLSLVVASGGYSSLWCAGFSLQWLLLLRRHGL